MQRAENGWAKNKREVYDVADMSHQQLEPSLCLSHDETTDPIGRSVERVKSKGRRGWRSRRKSLDWKVEAEPRQGFAWSSEAKPKGSLWKRAHA